MKNYNKETFQLSADCSSVLCTDKCDRRMGKIKSSFINAVNNIPPIKEVGIKQRTESWINLMIETELLKHSKVTDLNKTFYFQGFTKIFFQAQLETANKDSKSLWRILKGLGMPSKKGKASSISIGLNIGGEVCFN